MANDRSSRERPREPLGEAVRERVRVWKDWRSWWLPVTFGLVLLVLGVTVAYLEVWGTGSDYPLGDEVLGQVARNDLRAPESFAVLDDDATERKRSEAEASIRSVYDFETELGMDRTRRLREAFGEMQAILGEHKAAVKELENLELPPRDAPAADTADSKRPRSKKAARKPGARETYNRETEQQKELARLERELNVRLTKRKGEFLKLLQIVVNDEDFALLKADRFSVDSLNAVSRLIERNMRRMIVTSRELLIADRARGITVRYLRDGVKQREVEVVNFSNIRDLEEAFDRVETSAAMEIGGLEAPLRRTLVRLAKAMISPNMTFNRTETDKRKQEARTGVQDLETSYKEGEIIVRSGEKIQKKHLLAFKEMELRTKGSTGPQKALGTVILVALLLLMLVVFSGRNIRKFRTLPKDLAFLALVMFVSLISVKLWCIIFGAVHDRFGVFDLESYYYAIPFAAGAMLVRFVLNSEMALAFTAAFCVLAGLVMESSINESAIKYILYGLATSLVAAAAVGNVRQRTSLLFAGALTGLASMLLAIGLSLFGGDFISLQTVYSALFAFSGGILAAVIVTGVAPVIEVIFGYTTDIKLLELANLNHPLLKDLIVQAPGSYHHSIIVGSLVEAAAEAIHCNPLLARVMAYYHDIGKIKKPAYFSENQRDGVNRHDKLKPSLSASVLRAHVKDGAELAQKYRLGEPIVDAIVQHHGTSLMKFFYGRAKDQAEEEEAVKEDAFRYPGPKPRMREVALVMLADSVEAAAKSISDPSPARLQGLVQNMINRIFVDGQLDECDLTLQDLHQIARAFNMVLAGIYHHRPDYPEPATRDRDASERKAKSEAEKEVDNKRVNGEKREETPDDGQEDIKRLGI